MGKRFLIVSCVVLIGTWIIAQPSPHLGELLRAHVATNRPTNLKHRSGTANLDLEIPQLIAVKHAYILKNIPEGRTPVRCWQMTEIDATNTVWMVTNAANLMLIEIK